MKLHKVFILIMLINFLKSECGPGCLSCNENFQCVLCDFQHAFHFQVDTGLCVQNIIPYCVTYDLNGNCLKCDVGFYTEPNSLKCLEIPRSKLDPNCAMYNSKQQCDQCIDGHYPIGNKCQEVPSAIENCQVYKSAQHCQQCKEGYTPTLQLDECIKNPNISNCQTYTNIKCSKCQSNAIKVYDFLKSQIKLEINQQNVKTLDTIITEVQSHNVIAEDNCLFSQILHCLEYSGFNICKRCAHGYFLSEGLCLESPKEIIPNCDDYLNESTCKSCQQGYYLFNSSTCMKIQDSEKIEFCAEYNTTLNQPVCQRCLQTHFLSNQICQERQSLVDKCVEYHIDQDKCKQCYSQDLIRSVTTDGKKCLPATNLCSVYETSSINSTQLQCNTCQQGYYLNETTFECHLGNIQNCKIYKRISNECEVCLNKYYLKDSICQKHQEIMNCDQYDPTIKDSCVKCINASIKMEQTNTCIKVDITGCQQYISENQCGVCQDGYNLSVDKQCVLLSTSSHCLRAVNNICIKCVSGYFLKDEKCHQIFDYELKNCYLSNQDGQQGLHLSQECDVCVDYAVPYNLKDSYVCLKASELTSIFNENQFFVNNCSVYTNTNNSIKCLKCKRGFVLQNNTCVSSCASNLQMLHFNFIQTNNKIKYIENSQCFSKDARAQSVTIDNEFQITPFQLEDGYDYRIYYNRPTQEFKIVEPSELPGHPQSQNLYQLSMHRDIIQVGDLDKIENCEFYEWFHDDVYHCQTCKFGFFGEIVNYERKIENCNEYDTDDTCKYCKHEYRRNASKTQCTLSEIPKCEQYEINTANCLTCEDGYYRTSLTTCAVNTVTNCMYKHRFQNTCIQCDLYYRLSTNKQMCYQEIDNCQTYTEANNTLTCTECDLGYYPNTAKTQCLKGTNEFCLQYDQTLQDTCQYYYNFFKTQYDTDCQEIPKRYGCKEYSANFLTCQICQQNKYFYSREGKCCDPGTYPINNQNVSLPCQNTDSSNPHCKVWTYVGTQYQCSECYENYHLSNGTQCCHIGEFYDQGACQKMLTYNNSNTLLCTLFDIQEQKCHACTNGNYVSQNKCCPLNQYNQNGTCTNITQVTNCAKLADNLTDCLQCQPNYTLQNNICCNLSTHIFHLDNANENICYTKPTNMNCLEYQSSFTTVPVLKCNKCISDAYYMVSENIGCCKKGSDTVIPQIWDPTANNNTGGCINVPNANLKTGCEIYDSSYNCLRCQEEATTPYFLQYDGQCCKGDLNSDGTDCLQTSRIYQHCSSINKSNTIYCTSCEDGYYLSNNICVEEYKYFAKDLTSQNLANIIVSSITTVDADFSAKCTQMSDDKTKCVTCADGYYLPNDNTKLCCKDDQQFLNNVCVDVSFANTQNCMYFDLTTGQCAKSSSDDFLNLGFCKANHDQFYYITGSQSQCCALNTNDVSGTCQNNMNNCLIQSGSSCLQCEDGYSNQGSSCDALPSNCLQSSADNTKCVLCEDGYQFETTAGTCDTPANINIVFATSQNCMEITHNTTDVNQSTCPSCQKGYYVSYDHCCQWNELFLTNACISITDSNCAQATGNESSQSCTQCFLDQQHCYNYAELYYTYKPNNNSVYFEEKNQNIPLGFLEKYEIQKNTCCLKGQYLLNGSCVNMPQDSKCLYGQDDSGTFKCTICQDGYHSSNGKCCLVTQINNAGTCENDNQGCEDRFYNSTLSSENEKLYLSNQKCCRQHFYYNTMTQKCEAHPDTNCLKSNSGDNCLVCQQTTINSKLYSMKPADFYISSELLQVGGVGCQDKKQQYTFKPCILDTNTTDNVVVNTSLTSNNTINVIQARVDNCKVQNGFTCTECEDGYYMKNNYCCADDEFHRDGICIKKQLVLQECVNFDITTYTCKQCSTGYVITNGQCCQDNHVFDKVSMQCIQLPEYCRNFNMELKTCVECVEGSYNLNGQCCPYGTYFDLDKDECMIFGLQGMLSCKKGTKNTCQECYQYNILEGENVYINLSNGKCCSDGYYFNNGECQVITSEANCASVDSNDVCIKCMEGYSLDNVNNKCCPVGQLYSNSKCELHVLNCIDSFWDSSTAKCRQCEQGFYLTNQHCCQDDYYYNTTSNKCLKIQHDNLINCKVPREQLNGDGKLYCAECDTGFYLSDEIQLNTNGFTEQDKTVCCAASQVYDPQQNKCVDISTLTTNDYMIDTVANCTKANYFVSSQTTYAFCMECSNSEILQVLKQSSGFNTFDSNTKKVSCVTAAGVHNNCKIVQVSNLLAGDNQGCLKCTDETTTYLSNTNDIRCCNKGTSSAAGQFYQTSDDTCQASTDVNCEENVRNSADQCDVCLGGYFVDSTTVSGAGCTAETPNDNTTFCLQKQSQGSKTCQVCIMGYYLDGSNTCNQYTNTDIFNITQCSANLQLQCVHCFNNENLNQGGCCADNKFYDPIGQGCQDIGGYEGCAQYTDSQCLKCVDNSEYPDSGKCCPLGQKWNGSTCVNITFTGIDLQNCSKVDTNGQCIECQTSVGNYISNGRCCAQGKYFNNTSCVDINTTTYPNCNEFQTQCTSCSTGELQQDNCCGNTYWNGIKCANILTNCINMKIDGTCDQCQEGYYLTGGNCCRRGSIYVNQACTSITTSSLSTHTNCLQISDPTASNVQCDKCKESYYLTNGKCCLMNQYYDTVSSSCISREFIDNCANLNANYTCIECIQNYYLTSGKCCQEGYYYNTSNKKCEDISDAFCLQKTENQRCTKCMIGFYVNPVTANTNECCRVGMSSTNSLCQHHSIELDVPNCMKFDTTGNCSECQVGYNKHGNVCCPSGHVVFGTATSQEDCVDIDILYNNCASFNTLTLKCNTCKNDYYILNDQHICCAYNQHYEIGKGCVQNFEGCKIQQQHNCLECLHDTDYLSGETGKKRCCRQGQFVDYGNYQQCVDIDISGCAKAHLSNDVVVCDECAQGELQNGHCCLLGTIYDIKKGTCVDPIENCDIQCKECETGFAITDNTRQQCCAINQFYFATEKTCQKNINILDTNCQTINNATYGCTSCQVGHYLSGNLCCPFTKYAKLTDTKECTGIITTDYSAATNCIAHDRTNCLQCADGYMINTSKNCMKIFDNCSNFDVQNQVCLSCDQNHYITEGHCCQQGEKYITNQCTTPSSSINYCLKYKDGVSIQCQQCQQDYYVTTGNFCCQNGQFCTNSTTQLVGQVKYCKEYGTSVNDCIQCNENSSLVKIATTTGNASRTYCMPYSQENCLHSTIQLNSDVNFVNPLQCQKCKNFYQSVSVTKATLNLVHPKIEHCLVTMTTDKYESSQLTCIQCEQDYWLNGQTCQLRTADTYTNCRQFQKTQDACKECIYGYNVINNVCVSQVTTDCLVSLSSNNSVCNVCKDNLIATGSNTCGNCSTYDCLARDNLENYNDEAQPPILDQGLINGCEVHHQCTDKYLNGLDPELSKLLSCHVCNESDRIPFLSIKFAYNFNNQYEIGILQYDYHNSSQIGQLDENRKNYSSECLKIDLSEFRFSGTVNTSLFPSGCGIGMINTKEPTSLNQINATNIDINTSKLSIFCAACKPGYKPINSNIKYHVAQCQAIQNCKVFGSAFNECDQCNDGFAFDYVLEKGVNKSNCVQVLATQVNCYAFDQTNGICKACKKGYQTNHEGFCELLEVPYCQQGKSNKLHQFETYDWALAYYKGDIGCQQCQQGFYRFQRQIDDYVCLVSEYAKGNKFLTENSMLIKDCQKYQQTDQGLKCYQCGNNTVLDVNGICLTRVDNLKNCEIAATPGSCHTCSKDLVLVQPKCVERTIEFCQDYFNDKTTLTCKKCMDGYYLKENECFRGLFENCAIYQDEKICQKCRAGYEQITTSLNERKCIKVSIEQDCYVFDDDEFQDMKIECTQCTFNHILKSFTIPQKVCISLPEIDGCKVYDKGVNFQGSTLNCNECKEDYFMQENRCYKRQREIINCYNYEISKDTCHECIPGYYVIDEGLKCEPQPIGIYGCAVYLNMTQCSICKSAYYLSDNECKLVPEESVIQNCAQYNLDLSCEKCEGQFILLDNTCVEPLVQNCNEFIAADNCSKCNYNFKLQQSEEGKGSCVEIQILENCEIMQQIEPYACEKCKAGYYFNEENQKCETVPVDKVIKNCLDYTKEFDCKLCQDDYALSVNKRQCIQFNYDSNCQYFEEAVEPFCVACKQGYTINGEYQCVEAPALKISNCLVTRLNDEEVCGVCMPGYFMDEEFQCEKGNYDPKDNNQTDNDNQNEVELTDDQPLLLAMLCQLLILITLY